jgi:uncharacterized protein (TIGR02118 family)
MVKLLVLYRHPEDEAAFERHYAQKHLALARKIPGLRRLETSKIVTDDGSRPVYYRSASLHFDSVEDLNAGLTSAEGQASGADAASIATGGMDRLVLEVD